MGKKFIMLLMLIFNIISYSTEIDIILSGAISKEEKVILKQDLKLRSKEYAIDLEGGSGKVYYYDKDIIVKEEIYDFVKFKNHYNVTYVGREGRILEEESKILEGIQKSVEYYDYAKRKIKRITVYSGEYKILEINFNKNGSVEKVIEGKCKRFISVKIAEKNCRKQDI